jgi:hypothetical protein
MNAYIDAGKALPPDTIKHLEDKERAAKKAKRERVKIPGHKIRTATQEDLWATKDPGESWMRRHRALKANREADAEKQASRAAKDAKAKLEKEQKEATREEAKELREAGNELEAQLRKGAERERKQVTGGEVIVKNEDGTITVERYAPKIHLGGERGQKAVAQANEKIAKKMRLVDKTGKTSGEIKADKQEREKDALRVRCQVCGCNRRYEQEERRWPDDAAFTCPWLPGRVCRVTDTQMKERQKRAAAPKKGAAGPSSW